MFDNLPNKLSLLRILLIPILLLAYFLFGKYGSVIATGIFILAAITDWLDGYLARKWNETTALGAFIDPVADKLLVGVALLLILQQTPAWYILIPVIIIIGREIAISALREWMAEKGERNAVKVSSMGKLKTVFQMIAIGCLIFAHNGDNSLFGLPIFEIGIALLYIAAALTFVSMVQYMQSAWPILTNTNE